MRWYVDASIALHAVLPGGNPRARRWFDHTRARNEQVFSSNLLELELIRTLRRECIAPVRAQLVLHRISLISIDDGVLRVAASIEAHVKSLDAIHLATCLQLGGGLILATHDANMTQVGIQLGVDIFDPLTA